MNDVQQREAVKHFAEYWKGKGYEKGESQKFWLSLLGDVLGVEHAAEYISFEDQVHLDHTSFIDGYIPETHVLIEQKGIGKDLKKPIRQSDGSLLKPIEQAVRYSMALPYSLRPRWIIICNFECFHIYDMEHPQADPIEIKLEDLPTKYYMLEFLVRKEDISLQQEMEISIQAGELVGQLYDAFLKEYADPTNEHSLKSLNELCVRLVFCLYAEDAGIFGKRLIFHDYMQHKGLDNARDALIKLFKVLDTPYHERGPLYLDKELDAFPYVNGGLFSNENIEIPRVNENIYDLLLNKASAGFDWSGISPTIFGAVFESTLNPETRRKGGMHYTSIENIHKVIDPLFLNDLRKEFVEIKQQSNAGGWRTRRLTDFQKKLAALKFFDPACGSGNFLTESYICLRRLENEVILELQGEVHQMGLAILENPIKVSITQFYGIEINDFAATVARTALWIAESQMMKRTEDIVHMSLDFLPLRSYVNITCGNALCIDWNSVIPSIELNYIMGNPPFVGARLMSAEQKDDLQNVFSGMKNYGNLDYVSGWYEKTAEYMRGTTIRAALVSTNSITQGEQVPLLWKRLNEKGIIINFAYRTFRWDSEAKLKAHVHCVIIGFSYNRTTECKLFISDNYQIVPNINAYLVGGPNILIDSRKKPVCNVPSVVFGSMPNDGGKLSDYTDEDMQTIIKDYPVAATMFRPFLGATEFLHGKKRWCLWLKGIAPSDLKKVKPIMDAIAEVRAMRENSNRESTRKLAEAPSLFGEIRQPDTDYIIIPRHSSENRKYIPMGFVSPDIICGDSNLLLPNASLYQFGILMSNVHNAWMRTVCGRIKSDYRYSVNVVYNNFPWPDATTEQQEKIAGTAQAILDARALYPESSLADLYDDLAMPPELRKAHHQNDRAVWEAYGKAWDIKSENDCVAYLMKLYQSLT